MYLETLDTDLRRALEKAWRPLLVFVINNDGTFERCTNNVARVVKENGVSRQACPACPEHSRGKSVERVEAS